MSMRFRVALVAALLAGSGCTTTSLSSGGGVVPALGGGDDGSSGKVATRIINAMDGGLIGGTIGNGLNSDDRRKALEAEYRALEYGQGGQAVAWKGDGRSGEVVAAQPYRVGSQDCRQYSQTVFTTGTPLVARGTACRNADGSWTPLT
ncbi:surface antigen [Aminobacter aminovorans]|uniref:Surface antigen n=1 Tax=Aminobacter aminovorans TaxID=83263 RepID=A0A380WRY5_AMIAI|nr:surface antigen [Aminobacter aminovorans]SUU91056.1 Surface antigen [Aminobacter aminovorans]